VFINYWVAVDTSEVTTYDTDTPEFTTYVTGSYRYTWVHYLCNW